MSNPVDALLRGRRILIVEDDFFVGQALAGVLELAGAVVLGPIGWLDEAIDYIASEGKRIHAVVLDVNLHNRHSYPIADLLLRLGIPFVFATGYSRDSMDINYVHHARVEKPFDYDYLLARLGST